MKGARFFKSRNRSEAACRETGFGRRRAHSLRDWPFRIASMRLMSSSENNPDRRYSAIRFDRRRRSSPSMLRCGGLAGSGINGSGTLAACTSFPLWRTVPLLRGRPSGPAAGSMYPPRNRQGSANVVARGPGRRPRAGPGGGNGLFLGFCRFPCLRFARRVLLIDMAALRSTTDVATCRSRRMGLPGTA
jgi:hypothetical protein